MFNICIVFFSLSKESALLGQNIRVLVPSPWKEKHDSYMAMYVASRKSNIVNRIRNLPVQTSKEIVYATVFITEVNYNGLEVYNVSLEEVDSTIQVCVCADLKFVAVHYIHPFLPKTACFHFASGRNN
jgi:hypothetical protein